MMKPGWWVAYAGGIVFTVGAVSIVFEAGIFGLQLAVIGAAITLWGFILATRT